MTQFTLLTGGYKPKPDYSSLYINAFYRKTRELIKNYDKSIIKQLIFYGVKYLNSADSNNATREILENRLQISFSIEAFMGALTPNELMQIFPVTKEYDGARWQCKDYFYTMEELRKHGLDKPMGEAIQEILWDYMNPHLQTFTVNILSIASDLQRINGEKGILEEFAEQNGMPTYRLYKDQKGKEYAVNSQTGETHKVTKKKPRYLKVVKG